MAEDLDHPAQNLQHREDYIEEATQINEPLNDNTDWHEEQGEGSSNHSRRRCRTSRSHEDGSNRTAPSHSSRSHSSSQTLRFWHEASHFSEIEDFIYGAVDWVKPPARPWRLFEARDPDCHAWPSSSNSICPASFGDGGTTASAGAYGQLVQLSGYLGAGNSGMFSAGHSRADKTYEFRRPTADPNSLASEPFGQAQRRKHPKVFGLKFRDLELAGDSPPTLRWYLHRWPRYEYRGRCFKGSTRVGLAIQFIVRDGTVFQQCILESRGDEDVDLELAFCKGMSIWDLDHVTNELHHNMTTSRYQNAGPGPGGYGWVHVNQLHEWQAASADSRDAGHGNTSDSSLGGGNRKDKPNYGVALVVSMAVDGEMMRFSPEQSPHVWKQTLKARSGDPTSKTQKVEIVTAYKLVLLANPLSDWKNFVSPLKEMNTNAFLMDARRASQFRTSITRISEKDEESYSDDDRNSGTLKSEEGKGEMDIPRDEAAAADSEPQDGRRSPAVHPQPGQEKPSPAMDHIEFLVRRNLEHILGVCAIPVDVPGPNAGGPVWESLCDVQPIALTCGDMSGHRVCTASSFFAFQFLTEVAKRLTRLTELDRDDIHAGALLSRIRAVCLGHLKWLCAVEKTGQHGAFKAVYWVAGEAVPIAKLYAQFVPRENIPHTAFQILKALEFSKAFSDDEECDSWLVGEIISRWGRGMLRWLERYDRRESLSWYHKEDEGLKVFRLDDHVWIWRALRAMEDERYGVWDVLRGSPLGPEESDAEEMSRLRRKFASRTVQREVLRKFTTEHEILRKRMVALSRSPRETRFLLHARDTALLYGQDMGFFTGDSSSQEAWKSTLDAQHLHENNQEDWWDNALRYALSIMLGIRGHRINNMKPGSMVRTATKVLLRSISGNGLFPKKLDIMTKGPLKDFFHAQMDADSHYEAGFEIPYILLVHAKEIGSIVDDAAEPALENASGEVKLRYHSAGRNPNSTEAMPPHDTSNPQVLFDQREVARELRKLLEKLSDVLSARTYLLGSTPAPHLTGARELVADARLTLKKSIPLSNVIDSHNIVEIGDEWLFNYPEFFGSENDEDASVDEALDSLRAGLHAEITWIASIHFGEMRRKYSSGKEYYRAEDQPVASHSPLEDHGADEQNLVSYYSRNSESYREEDQSTALTYHSSSVSTESSIWLDRPRNSSVTVGDMPSRKHLRGTGAKPRASFRSGSPQAMWKLISAPRTAARAKKRVIFWNRLRVADPGHEAALLCYAASKGAERASLLEFFERYFRHENFVFDHCSLAHNTWETELHLRYFILAGASVSSADLNAEGFPEIRRRNICRSSVGVRLSGDAFDRFWTVHMFSNDDPEEMTSRSNSFNRSIQLDDNLYFQRKVLELHIFASMLGRVESSTEQILTEVKSEMGIKSGAFSWSVPSMDTYSYWRKVWEDFAPLLQALAGDLASALDVISQWETQEAGRGQERPRWTRNDERKYRAAITRGRRVLVWRRKGARDLLAEVESLREACAARLANARDELSFRSSQDIASFTYVTIVFLPLGFAASVFSMNGYPAAAWVGSMAVIAVVTLAVTVVALANAKMLLGAAEKLSKDALKVTNAVMETSLVGQQQKRRRAGQEGGSHVPDRPARDGQAGRGPLHSHVTRYVLFWMAYLLIELPARRVGLACRALPASLMQSLGLRGRDASSSSPTSVVISAIGRKLIRVAGGILILPLLLVSWTIQILFYNFLDVLTLLGRLALRTLRAVVAPGDAQGPATDSEMVTWLIEPPPSLRPVRKFMTRDKESEKLPPRADTPVPAGRSGSGSAEEV